MIKTRLTQKCLLIGSLLMAACQPTQKKTIEEVSSASAWDQLPAILEGISKPEFPNVVFAVEEYGAIANDETSDAEAIQKAINVCHEAGGGVVAVAKGIYYVKSLYLKSNVNLQIAEGSELRFSTVPEDYLPLVHTRWEGVEMKGLKPLIYAYEETNIAVTGKGILNGQASRENWWAWCGSKRYGWKEGMLSQHNPDNRPTLFQMGQDDVPVEERIFGIESRLRPQFFQPYKCQNVLVEGVTFKDSPMWIMHPTLCTDVTIDGVSVISHGPNSDGCDPESCKDVLIKNCYFDTGDDCIAIKSGRNRDGRRIGVASENIVIQNCVMKDGHGGVVIGSEISGGAKNVFAEDCFMDSPNLDRALRIKTSSKRGGIIENVHMRNVEVGQVREAVVKFNMFYEKPGDFMPTIRDISVENVTVKNGGKYGVLARAYEESPVENVHIKNVKIDSVKEELKLENIKNFHLENVFMNGQLVTFDN